MNAWYDNKHFRVLGQMNGRWKLDLPILNYRFVANFAHTATRLLHSDRFGTAFDLDLHAYHSSCIFSGSFVLVYSRRRCNNMWMRIASMSLPLTFNKFDWQDFLGGIKFGGLIVAGIAVAMIGLTLFAALSPKRKSGPDNSE